MLIILCGTTVTETAFNLPAAVAVTVYGVLKTAHQSPRPGSKYPNTKAAPTVSSRAGVMGLGVSVSGMPRSS